MSVWNAGKEIKKFPALPAAASAVAFSTNGAVVAAGLGDNSIRLLKVADGKEVKEHPRPCRRDWRLDLFAQGDLLISANAHKTVRLSERRDGAPKGQLVIYGAD